MMTAKEDIRRRIDLERADAAKKAIEEGIEILQNDSAYKHEIYLKAKKRYVGLLTKLKAKF